MNEYDNDNDNDELDDYSGSSFRARSNTWPLNKPDLAAPSSNVCIDETLPEIELEEDDLFTTNENWSAGFVDHDIMSWDPILNAQNQQQQASNQPPIIHHQPQQAINHAQQSSEHHQQQPHQTSHGHQRQQSIHLHHQLSRHPQQQHLQQRQQQQQQQHSDHQHTSPQAVVGQPHAHLHQQQHSGPHHRPQQGLETFLDGSGDSSEMMIGSQNAPQVQQQPSPHQPDRQQLQHQTLNSSHCLDADDPNEYHIHQLHHLRLDGSSDTQQDRYTTTVANASIANNASPSHMPPMGIHSANQVNDYAELNITTGHHHHHHHHHSHQQSHMQSLSSTRYNFDQQQQQQSDYDIKLAQDDNLNNQHHQHLNHLDHHQHHHQTDHTNSQHQFDQPTLSHHQHLQQSSHHHQYHDLTASSLDNGNCGSHMLSSSLSTSGIGLSTDLEDLDYKPVNTATILSNSYDDQLQQRQQDLQQSDLQSKSSETLKSELQSSSSATKNDSISASKTKLNAPRRNAWGNMSYADLISQAIESTSDKRLTLSQIYDWMVQHVPYFKDKGDSNSSAGWKNSVRHNLSLHSRFKRLQNEGTGKSSWWTINPEANTGKCARRRAASMEASKYEKKRGRAKKRAEAIRQGLVSQPSLTNSSLNGSTNTLGEQQTQALSISHFHTPTTTTQSKSSKQQQQQQQQQKQEHNLQSSDEFANQQQQAHMPELQIQTLENYNIDHPSQQQQQHLRQLQQADRQERQQQQTQNCGENTTLQHDTHHGYDRRWPYIGCVYEV